MADFELSVPFTKRDDSLRTVWGWASLATQDGQPVVDLQGDIIAVEELQKAAHEFMDASRTGGIMHIKDGDTAVKIGTVVDSIVLTSDVQKALGIALPCEGWWIGVKVHDDSVWRDVQSGKLGAFSIGGSGVRTAVE